MTDNMTDDKVPVARLDKCEVTTVGEPDTSVLVSSDSEHDSTNSFTDSNTSHTVDIDIDDDETNTSIDICIASIDGDDDDKEDDDEDEEDDDNNEDDDQQVNDSIANDRDWKYISCVSINVGGLLSKLSYPDFTEFIGSHDIICISESKLSNTDFVHFDGYTPFFKNRLKCTRKSGGILVLIRNSLANYVTVYELEELKSCIDESVIDHYEFTHFPLCQKALFFTLDEKIIGKKYCLGLFTLNLRILYILIGTRM